MKSELLKKLQAIPLEQALFPTQNDSLDTLILQLERLNPTPTPLQTNQLPELYGDWTLIYASRGTVVTRNVAPLTQNLLTGIKIKRIWQRLGSGSDRSLQAQNCAELEFPWLGTWKLQADGQWHWEESELQTAKVSFNAFAIQALNLFGQSWSLPELRIPVLEALRREALWITSYLDADLRIGRGATGNLFVFRR